MLEVQLLQQDLTRLARASAFDPDEVFISPKEVTPSHTVHVSGWSGSSRDRFRRCCWTGSTTPTALSTSSLVITMSSWRRFGSSLPRSGRYSLINKKDKRPQDCCKDAKTILEEEVVSTAIENDAKGVYNGEDFPNWKWTPVIKRGSLICLHRLFDNYISI